MNRFRSLKSRPRTWLWVFFCAFALAMVAGLPIARTKAALQSQKQHSRFANLDVRVNGGKSAVELLQARPAALARVQGMATSMKNAAAPKSAQTKVTFSTLTGSAEVVEGQSGALTAPSSGRSGKDIVVDYLRANASVYGLSSKEIDALHFIGESVSPSGLRMVRFEQVVNGVPIFQSETRAIIDRNGSLVRTLGLLVPGTDYAESLANVIPATQALASAMRGVGVSLSVNAMTVSSVNAEGTRATVLTTEEAVSGEVEGKLVYFPLGPGILIPAWSQIIFTNAKADYYSIVDAQTGVPLWRKNIRSDASAQDARFRVYVQADGTTPADSPAPHSPTTNTVGSGTQYPGIAPQIVSMHTAYDPIASPNGWIDDCPGGGCTAAQTQTIGNNVHAYMDAQGGANNNLPDTNAAFMLDGNGKPTGNPDANGRNRDFLGTTPRDFQTNYLPPPQGGNPEAGQTSTGNGTSGTAPIDQYRRGVVTHLFYVTNWYHDQLYKLGFNEAAGNFQQTNFSGMGLGADRVLAEAQDNTSTNNANFSTPPDGMSGRAQMYRFTGPTIDRDGDLDQEILMHELTHGTSNRLIGNGAGLNWDIGGGMGEGWSDFFALSLLNNTNADNPNGLYASGAWGTYKLAGFPFTDNYVYGIRRFPYSTDNTINPMTWADVDQITNDLSGGIPPTNGIPFNLNGAAEVHNTGEIWCLTLWEVRSRVIADPAGANGDVPTGNHTMLQLITDSLKMTPISPSFIDARDAIIAADGATNAYANEDSIWGGFADRGLGYNASAPLGILFAPASSYVGIKESFSVPFLDKGTITLNDTGSGNSNGAIDPGEQFTISVPLFNPWHRAIKNVASATATLTSSTPGVTIVTGSATYGPIAAQATVNGTAFTVRVASSVTCGQLLNFTVVTNSSLGSSTFTFTRRVGTPSGTGTPIVYTKTESPALAFDDDQPTGKISTLTITDDVEIADLNFRVNTLTHDFVGDVVIGLKGPTGYGTTPIAFIDGVNDFGGTNISNMVIDDSATNDMLFAVDTDAPYTGSWKTVFNLPSWALVGFGPPDAVGQLSRFNGTSPKGDWKVVVSDQVPQDSGSLGGWSLIITPVAFTCTAVICPPPSIVCPANVTQSNDPNQCGAVVSFTTPTATSACSTPGAVTCSPASGSFFPKGTTTVTCSSTDDQAHTGSCSFTVTVNDTQPPSVTCPPNQTFVTPTVTSSCVTGSFTATATDNCPGVTVVCSPASGSCFPVGTTTVTCTATDTSSNTATCSFTVSVFNGRLQDDSGGCNNTVLFNTITGDYRWCCSGTTFTGKAKVTALGSTYTLEHNAVDRRVLIKLSAGTTPPSGTGSLQSPVGTNRCTITDRDTRNDTCACGVSAMKP